MYTHTRIHVSLLVERHIERKKKANFPSRNFSPKFSSGDGQFSHESLLKTTHLNAPIVTLPICLKGCGATELRSSENVGSFAHLVQIYLDKEEAQGSYRGPKITIMGEVCLIEASFSLHYQPAHSSDGGVLTKIHSPF